MYRLNLHQIVRLRRALLRWRKLAHKSERSLPSLPLSAPSVSPSSSSPSRPGRATLSSLQAARIPAGHLAVYVGPERERFIIKMSVLGHPLFKALLKKSEEEVGFQYEGGLTIPCEVSAFQRLLHLIVSQGKPRPDMNAQSAEMMMRTDPSAETIASSDCSIVSAAAGEVDPQGFHKLLQELARFHVKEISSQLQSPDYRVPESPTVNLMQVVDAGFGEGLHCHGHPVRILSQ